MRYMLSLPSNMDDYEQKPGDFDAALRQHIDSWLGDQWSIQPIEEGSDLALAIDGEL